MQWHAPLWADGTGHPTDRKDNVITVRSLIESSLDGKVLHQSLITFYIEIRDTSRGEKAVMEKIKTLVIDDEPHLLELTKIFLESHNDISVEVAGSAHEALSKIDTGEYEVIVSDYQMPSMDGLQLLRSLKEKKCDVPFILFTGRGRESVAVDALNLGASFYLQKGGDPGAQFIELANMIRRSSEALRSKKQLMESENRFRNLVQNSSDFIVIIDRAGHVVYSSSSIERILGYGEQFLVGKSPLHIIHPDDHSIALSEMNLVTNNRHDGLPAEFRIRKLDGQYIPVEAIGKNMFGVPNVDGMVITTRPIAERKKAETALRESEELYHTLFDKSPISISLSDIGGRFVDVNEKHLELTGLTKEQIVGKHRAELGNIEEEGPRLMTEGLVENLGTADQHPMKIKLPNERTLHLVVSTRFIKFKGETHVLSMSSDVTDLMEMKEDLQVKNNELEQVQERLRTITDQTPNVVYQLIVRPDRQMQFIFVSKRVEKMLLAPWQRCLESIEWERVLTEDREPMMMSIFEVMETRSLWEREFRITDLEGNLKWILGTASPSSEQSDGSVIWTGTFTDITERKKNEEVLRQMNRQLNLMTSITRHDCLNKITVALGYLELAYLTRSYPRSERSGRRSILRGTCRTSEV
jgi:PAS domain S-box-containing protein